MSQKIEHTGIITSIEGEKVLVQIAQLSACSSCHAKGACSASDVDEKIIEVQSTDTTLKTGDFVQITGNASMGLFAVLIAFVIPFSLILLSLATFNYYAINEALAGTISLGILIPYYLVLSQFNHKLKTKLKFTIIKI